MKRKHSSSGHTGITQEIADFDFFHEPEPDPEPEKKTEPKQKKETIKGAHVEDEIDKEIQELYAKYRDGNPQNDFLVLSLVGHGTAGGIFAPQECTFVVDPKDEHHMREVQKAIVAKARKWRNNLLPRETIHLVEASGKSSVPITSVGGVHYGYSRIPTAKTGGGRVLVSATEKKTTKKQKKA